MKENKELHKRYPMYDVQKFGVTIEWDTDVRKAESAFNQASPGGVIMYRMEPGSSVKKAVRRK